MTRLLQSLSASPGRTYQAGSLIIEEGTRTGRLFVLRSGRLEISRDGVRVALENTPGSVFGEMSLLLGRPHTASVRALAPSELVVLEDAGQMLERHPELVNHIAFTLAQRLETLTHYLVDVKSQFGDQDSHLSMIDDIVATLVRRQASAPRKQVA
ncbi:MAG: cyclic nucleotide-binding domain-containing protein [Geminicoccaceae bacterium]